MAESKFAPRSRRDSMTKKKKVELDGATTAEKFTDLCGQNIAFEAKWFLKAYWGTDLVDVDGKNYGKIKENLDIAEHVFDAHTDMKKRAKGDKELDQLDAHHFLEAMGEAITYTKFKKKFSELDLDFNNKLSLSEYLVHHFNIAVKGNLSHIEVMVNKKMVEVKGLAAAEEAMQEASKDVEDAEKAQADVEEIMALIEKKKMNHGIKADKHRKNIEKHQASAVKRGIHQTKLREHMNKPAVDNKTELTQKAAVRRQKKASKAARMALTEAEKEVERIKSSGVQAGATLWWMERKLKEMEKTMSKKAFAKKMAKLEKKKAAAEADDAAMSALGGK